MDDKNSPKIVNLAMSITTRLIRVQQGDMALQARNSLLSRFFVDLGGKDNEILDLDKSAEGMSFIVTGKVSGDAAENPLSQLFNCPILDGLDRAEDAPTFRILAADGVKTLHHELSKIEASALSDNYNPLIMTAANVYPVTIWEYGREPYDYLLNHFSALKNFVAKAAAENLAIVVMVN